MTSGLRPVGHAVALIKRARGRECECPLRVKRESAYAGSNYVPRHMLGQCLK